MCNGKVPWTLKVLHENLDANKKEPLLLRANATVISYQLIWSHTTILKTKSLHVTREGFRPDVTAPWDSPAKNTNQQSVNVFKDPSPCCKSSPLSHAQKRKKPHEIIIVTAPETHLARGDFTSHSSLLTEEVLDSSCRSGEVMKTDEISYHNASEIKLTTADSS